LPSELCPFQHETRDHRGLNPWEKILYERAHKRLGNVSMWGPLDADLLTDKLREGKIPFAKCKNPKDVVAWPIPHARMWGRYFDAATNTVTTKPLPPKKRSRLGRLMDSATDLIDDVKDWVEGTLDTFRKIGGQLLDQFANIIEDAGAFLEVVIAALVEGICNMLDADWKRKLVVAGAVLAGAPPAAAELIIKIARALCDLLKIIEAEVSNTIKAMAALVITGKLLI
jgi:hypothetical protein